MHAAAGPDRNGRRTRADDAATDLRPGLVRAVAATLLSAVAYVLAFPPTGLWPAAWVALVPLFVVLRQGSALRAAGLAWLWTVVSAWGIGDWLPRAIAHYYEQPFAVGLAFFFAIATLTAALEYQAFALVHRRLGGAPAAVAPLLAGAAWIGAELARVRLPGGDPWGLVGYSQAGVAPLVQVADLGGAYAIGFPVIASNAALAALWTARRDGLALRAAAGGLAVAMLVAAAGVGYGACRLATLRDAGPAASVAIVQGNVPVAGQWNPERYGRNLDVYLRLTRDVLTTRRPVLLVWPESAMTFFLETEPTYRRAIARVTAGHGVQLLAGGPHQAAGGGFHNAAFLLDAGGDVVARYDKRRLLPFGEYFPLPALDLMRRRFGRVREFVAGVPGPPLPTAAGAAGVLVCNEAFFAEPAATRVREGAELLVTLANDSWTSDRRFAQMAFDMARVRAVEQRRWLVRASTWGPSAVVDPAGRTAAASPTGTEAFVEGDVHRRRDLTPYARAGDAFALLCAVAAGVATAYRRGGPPALARGRRAG